MAHSGDILGLLMEARDAINTEDASTAHVPPTILGVLQNIRDLLNTEDESIAAYGVDVNGVLTNIRDLLNTEDASVADYAPNQRGLWQAIVAFGNTEDDPVDTNSTIKCIQSFRDLAVLGRIPAGDWWDDSSFIHIDFLGGDPQGRAWLEGTGEVAISTLLGADENTEAAWGTSSYSADNIEADGYVIPNEGGTGNVAFIGAARTKILAGCTASIQFKQVEVSTDPPLFAVGDATGEYAVFFDIAMSGDASIGCFTGDVSETIVGAVNWGVGAVNRIAFTITPTRAELAANGSAAVGDAISTDEYPTSGENQIVLALFNTGQPHHAIQSIKIYDTLPTTVGLSELSEV